MWETIAIILSLGGLELLLWWINDKKDSKVNAEQLQVLEDIAVTLSIRENKEVPIIGIEQGKN